MSICAKQRLCSMRWTVDLALSCLGQAQQKTANANRLHLKGPCPWATLRLVHIEPSKFLQLNGVQENAGCVITRAIGWCWDILAPGANLTGHYPFGRRWHLVLVYSQPWFSWPLFAMQIWFENTWGLAVWALQRRMERRSVRYYAGPLAYSEMILSQSHAPGTAPSQK